MFPPPIAYCHCFLDPKQEILANAKVTARQQCVYDGHYRRNLPRINHNAIS